jgi:hypothetical protein
VDELRSRLTNYSVQAGLVFPNFINVRLISRGHSNDNEIFEMPLS